MKKKTTISPAEYSSDSDSAEERASEAFKDSKKPIIVTSNIQTRLDVDKRAYYEYPSRASSQDYRPRNLISERERVANLIAEQREVQNFYRDQRSKKNITLRVFERDNNDVTLDSSFFMDNTANVTGDTKDGKRIQTDGSEGLRNRATINYNDKELTKEALEDLDLINKNLQINKDLPFTQAMKGIKTRFNVAQYRGINYINTKWDKAARKAHRERNEVGQPYYSMAVAFGPYDDTVTNFSDLNQRESVLNEVQKRELERQRMRLANSLKIKMEHLRKRGPVRLAVTETDSVLANAWFNNITYDNLLELLQAVYTNNYTAYEYLLNSHFFKDRLLNNQSPFVSTAETPYHALRYAYGLKEFANHEDEKLRPEWDQTGRARHPKVGKVYISLHELADFDDALHLVSMGWRGEVKVNPRILTERETSFPALIESDRVIYQHVAKFPSFKQPYRYKNIYISKYGLDEVRYKLFFDAFYTIQRKHGTPDYDSEMNKFRSLLGEYLCCFHEFRFVEIARRCAVLQNSILVYRDELGWLQPAKPQKYSTTAHAKISKSDEHDLKNDNSFSIDDEDETKSIIANSELSISMRSRSQLPKDVIDSRVIGRERITELWNSILIPGFQDADPKKQKLRNGLQNLGGLERESLLRFKNEGDGGKTLLHYAIEMKDLRIIRLLAHYGADPHDLNKTRIDLSRLLNDVGITGGLRQAITNAFKFRHIVSYKALTRYKQENDLEVELSQLDLDDDHDIFESSSLSLLDDGKTDTNLGTAFGELSPIKAKVGEDGVGIGEPHSQYHGDHIATILQALKDGVSVDIGTNIDYVPTATAANLDEIVSANSTIDQLGRLKFYVINVSGNGAKKTQNDNDGIAGEHWVSYIQVPIYNKQGEIVGVDAVVLNSASNNYAEGVNECLDIIRNNLPQNLQVKVSHKHLNYQSKDFPNDSDTCGVWVCYFFNKILDTLKQEVGQPLLLSSILVNVLPYTDITTERGYFAQLYQGIELSAESPNAKKSTEAQRVASSSSSSASTASISHAARELSRATSQELQKQ